MKTCASLLFCLLFTIVLSAQKDPIKWGKIDQADLDMKEYELDPEAEAVVLTDYAQLKFNFSSGDTYYVFEHHVRIKILKKSAFGRGDISIPYYSYQDSERISGLKAQVILPNGKKVEVSKKDIFEEEVNKYWSSKKFAFAGLKEGCIIEYKYSKRSDQIYYLNSWYFQSDIPTRLSEYRTSIPEWYNYISFTQGIPPVTETSKHNESMTVPIQRVETFKLRKGTRKTGGSVNAPILNKRYYLENVPALKSERYITTMRDYYAKLSLQLQYLKFPNSPIQDVTTTWQKEAKEMEESEHFGNQINKKRHTKKLMEAVAPLLNEAKDDREKVSIIYTFLSQNIGWNELYSYTSNSLDHAFEKKSAKSGELNLMLIALCRQLEIKALPILISTRTHGRTLEYYPKTSQFNHVIAYVEIGEQQFLFDVGSSFRDPALLRRNSLNYKGWLMDGERSQWIDLPTAKDQETMIATIDMDEQGNLSGFVERSFEGYCAMDERRAFQENKKEGHKNVRENWQKSFPDIEIETIEFEDEHKIAEALKCKIAVKIPQAAQVTGDFIYLVPMLSLAMEENPLKLEKRTFPVDIPTQMKEQYILNLSIPEGYVVEELPEVINMRMERDAGQFQFLTSQNGNKIQVISKIIISKLHYEPEEYLTLKNFFEVIVEKQGEQIVLKKQQ